MNLLNVFLSANQSDFCLLDFPFNILDFSFDFCEIFVILFRGFYQIEKLLIVFRADIIN